MPGINRNTPPGKGGARGASGGPLYAGPGGFCVCPKCGHRDAHVAGEPCNQKTCPSCGTTMQREI